MSYHTSVLLTTAGTMLWTYCENTITVIMPGDKITPAAQRWAQYSNLLGGWHGEQEPIPARLHKSCRGLEVEALSTLRIPVKRFKTFTALHAGRCPISCHSQMFPCRCSQRSLFKGKFSCLRKLLLCSPLTHMSRADVYKSFFCIKSETHQRLDTAKMPCVNERFAYRCADNYN